MTASVSKKVIKKRTSRVSPFGAETDIDLELSRHARRRMIERGIRPEDINLALEFGTERPASSGCVKKHSLVLVDLPIRRKKDRLACSIGHSSLRAALSLYPQIDVRPVVRPNAALNDVPALVEEILNSSRDNLKEAAVGFGVYIWNRDVVRLAVEALRGNGYTGRIVLGGPEVSYATDDRLSDYFPGADAFIRGPAERSLPRWILTGANVPEPNDFVLNDLPSPILTGIINLVDLPFMHWETGRGCPFNCTFCQHRDHDRRIQPRHFAWPRIKAEIRTIIKSGVHDIKIVDPIFNSNPLAQQILAEFRRLGFTGRISCECRPEMITTKFLDACQGIDVCFEFGLQTAIPREAQAICRRNDLARFEWAVGEAARRGIEVTASIISGLPLQTRESFQETIAFLHRCGVRAIQCFPLMVCAGTAIERDLDKYGLLVEAVDGLPIVVETRSMSRDELAEIRARSGL